MTFPNPGPATQTTANLAGGPYGAWSGTNSTGLIGPAGSLVSIGGGGVLLGAGANTISSGTAVFSNANGVSFGFNGNTITASVPAVGGAQTGISGIADANGTQTVGTLSFSNANGVTFGLSTGANTGTITASVASQTVQTQAAGNIGGTGFSTTTTNGVVIVGTNATNGVTLAVPPYITTWTVPTVTNSSWTVSDAATSGTVGQLAFTNLNGMTLSLSTGAAGSHTVVGSYTVPTVTQYFSNTATTFNGVNVSGSMTLNTAGLQLSLSAAPGGGGGFSGGVSTGGNTLGNTGTQTGQIVFAGGNNITLSVATAAGGAQTITISGANAGGAQTGISGIQVSNTTYTSGTVVWVNSNGISFGSSGAQSITASYTVPVTAGLISGTFSAYAQSNTTQSTSGTFPYNSFQFAGAGNVSVGVSNGSIVISGATAAGATTGGAYLQGNTTGQSSSSTYALSSFNVSGAGIISVGWSNSSLIVSGPGTTAFAALTGAADSANTQTTGLLSFANSHGISFGISTGANTGTITASYTVPTVPALSIGVSTGGNTLGNTGIYSGQVVFAGGNNVTLSVSTAAGGAQTITISGANAGGAQTGISGIVVSNTTYTSGTVSFSNANGISFGSSAGQAITASYTVPTQTNQSMGLYFVGNTTNTSSSTADARSLSFSALGALTAGYTNAAIQLSVPQTSSLVGTSGMSVSTNGSTISVYPIAVSTYVPYWPASTSSLLLNVLGVSSANPVFFPFQVVDALNFNMIAMLQSYSFVPATLSAASATEGVRFGLYSNNASTWSLISSGSSSIGITNSAISVTISYATATSTSGYGYGTQSSSITLGIESAFGTLGFRNPIMQFGGNISVTPGWYAIGLISTASSSSTAIGINQALIGNVVPVSQMYGMGQSTTVTNQMLGMGYGTATTTGLPSSMAFSNMTNSLGIIPIITIMST